MHIHAYSDPNMDQPAKSAKSYCNTRCYSDPYMDQPATVSNSYTERTAD